MQPSRSSLTDLLRRTSVSLEPAHLASGVRRRHWWSTCLGLWAFSATVAAQEPPADVGSTAPPPPLLPTEPSTSPPAAESPAPATSPPSSQYECVPACRAGYVCVQNQCVSACNPACSAGEVCQSDGRCVSACNPGCPAGQQCTGPGVCSPSASPAPAVPPPTTYQAPVPAEGEYTAPSEPPVKGKRFHDGFYLRLGVGAGFLMGTAQLADDSSETQGLFDEVGVVGMAIPVEFALGGTPAPGFAIGVGSYAVHVPSAKYSSGRGDYSVEERAEYGSISMLGPFFDYYVDPRAGIHIELSPGLAWVTPGKSDIIVDDDTSGSGFGIMAGFGVEGWISDNWGMGVLARGQFVSVKLEDESGTEFDFYAFVPSLLLTATWH